MGSKRRITKGAAKLQCGFVFLIISFMSAAGASAQYPSQSQVAKDGTAVLLEDYANPPLSSPTHGGATQKTINFKAPLGRLTSLRSEPAHAPLAASRFFVVDQSDTIYILNKATKEFTPYINFVEFFRNLSRTREIHQESFPLLSIPAMRKTANSRPLRKQTRSDKCNLYFCCKSFCLRPFLGSFFPRLPASRTGVRSGRADTGAYHSTRPRLDKLGGL